MNIFTGATVELKRAVIMVNKINFIEKDTYTFRGSIYTADDMKVLQNLYGWKFHSTDCNFGTGYVLDHNQTVDIWTLHMDNGERVPLLVKTLSSDVIETLNFD